jgi:hypothetical protein
MSEEEWLEWITDPLIFEKGGVLLQRRQWVEILFKEHIFPILKKNGFQLMGKPEKIIRMFLWFWRHLSLSGYDSADQLREPLASKSLTRPIREYYDIFFHKFNYSIFEYLGQEMVASVGAFDDTYLGRRLLAELPNFLWSFIDLVNSSEFVKHEKVCAEYDDAIRQIEESEMTIEELDRRRMKKNSGYDPDYVYDKHN